MTARLTRREAEQLGLELPANTRTTKRVGTGPYLTVCATCAEVFTTAAGEDRHVATTDHRRFDVAFVVKAGAAIVFGVGLFVAGLWAQLRAYRGL